MREQNLDRLVGIPYKFLGTGFDGADCIGLCQLFFYEHGNVVGHRDFNATECPGNIIYGVCRDNVCYVGKLGCFHAQEHHSMKTLKHWHHRPVNRIIFRPSTSFKSYMKSLSKLWH